VCLALADLPENDDEAKRLGNHYHSDEFVTQGVVQEGSTPFVLLYGSVRNFVCEAVHHDMDGVVKRSSNRIANCVIALFQ
jgi:hypothetical protein